MNHSEHIEGIIREFDDKTNASNYRKNQLPHHKLEEGSLLDVEWYPESAYELDKDKIKDWLRSQLTSLLTIREGEIVEMIEGLKRPTSGAFDDGLYDAVDLVVSRNKGLDDIISAIKGI